MEAKEQFSQNTELFLYVIKKFVSIFHFHLQALRQLETQLQMCSEVAGEVRQQARQSQRHVRVD